MNANWTDSYEKIQERRMALEPLKWLKVRIPSITPEFIVA